MTKNDPPSTVALSRRALLKAGAVALFALGPVGPSFLTRAALAAREPGASRRRKVLVTVFLRGAMDGVAAVPPLTDPGLARLRPRLALDRATPALDLDGRFGLHPAFAPLLPLWQERSLAIVHGVGSPDPTRSHFDAQDFMESGTPGRKGTASGWLNRAVGLTGHDATPFRAVASTAALPRSLTGPAPALAVADLADFRLGGPSSPGAGAPFEELSRAAPEDPLSAAARDAFAAVRTLSELDVRSYRPAAGAMYPRTPLGRSLEQIALLIKAGVGLEVAFAESGGWDTHVAQGAGRGTFARRAEDLAVSLAAFWTDLGAHRDDVTVMTMTEFGRTVAENGSGGTDHGHGSCLFVLGAQVDGGKVHGSVPTLVRDALHEGRDLPVTTDFRAVFSSVAGHQLGVTDDTLLFPGWHGPRARLFRA